MPSETRPMATGRAGRTDRRLHDQKAGDREQGVGQSSAGNRAGGCGPMGVRGIGLRSRPRGDDRRDRLDSIVERQPLLGRRQTLGQRRIQLPIVHLLRPDAQQIPGRFPPDLIRGRMPSAHGGKRHHESQHWIDDHPAHTHLHHTTIRIRNTENDPLCQGGADLRTRREHAERRHAGGPFSRFKRVLLPRLSGGFSTRTFICSAARWAQRRGTSRNPGIPCLLRRGAARFTGDETACPR